MRNNLIVCNIKEIQNEKHVETEKIVRDFMVDKRKLAQEFARSVGIERAHRMGSTHVGAGTSRGRNIVVRFTLYKDREAIRSKRPELNGSPYYFHEQFPPQVVAKRRSLVPKMKQTKQQGKTAWISYDTLFIDGKPVKSD